MMEFQLHKQHMKPCNKSMLHITQKQAKNKNDEDNSNPKGKVMIYLTQHKQFDVFNLHLTHGSHNTTSQ